MRTAWHTLIRPTQVLDAYMTGGPTGHGQYARPLRLYLALCGILMLVLFLMGGATIMFAALSMVLMTALSVLAFVRGGRGRWYRTLPMGVAKGLFLTLVTLIGATIAMLPILAIGIFGGMMAG